MYLKMILSPSPTITKHNIRNLVLTMLKMCMNCLHKKEELNLFSSAIKLPTQYMHTLWFSLNFKDVIQYEDVLENLNNSEFLMATEKMSSNKVFLLARSRISWKAVVTWHCCWTVPSCKRKYTNWILLYTSGWKCLIVISCWNSSALLQR